VFEGAVFGGGTIFLLFFYNAAIGQRRSGEVSIMQRKLNPYEG